MSTFYSAEDAFWGQLGGCLEMIDGGTTTVVDHASITLSPQHRTVAPAWLESPGLSLTPFQPTKPSKQQLHPEFDLFLPTHRPLELRPGNQSFSSTTTV